MIPILTGYLRGLFVTVELAYRCGQCFASCRQLWWEAGGRGDDRARHVTSRRVQGFAQSRFTHALALLLSLLGAASNTFVQTIWQLLHSRTVEALVSKRPLIAVVKCDDARSPPPSTEHFRAAVHWMWGFPRPSLPNDCLHYFCAFEIDHIFL